MSYTLEDFRRDSAFSLLNSLTPDPHFLDYSLLINEVLAKYREEGIDIPYSQEDFRRDFIRSLLNSLTPEERLAGLAPEEILTYYKPEQLLSGLTIEQRLAGLSAQELESLSKRLQSEPRNGESVPDDA